MASVTYYRDRDASSTAKWHLLGKPGRTNLLWTQCGIYFHNQPDTTTTPDPNLICRRCERGDNHLKG
jgi:hypothetical protein